MDTQLDDEALAGLAVLAPEDDPALLRQQAAALSAAAGQAIATPAQLFLESAQKNARAQTLERRAGAVEAVSAASEEVAACETALEATAEPERVRASKAFDALRAVQDRHRELVQATDDDEAVEDLIERRKVLGYAEEVLAVEESKLADVTKVREVAQQDLDRALVKRREARGELRQIEDSLASPLASDLGPAAQFLALFFAWPYRLTTGVRGFGPPLSQGELNACRLLAGLYADFANVIPDGAARKVRELDQDKQEVATASALNSVTIPMGDGRSASLGQLLGLPNGAAGR